MYLSVLILDKSKPSIIFVYVEDDFDYKLWHLLNKKVVSSNVIVVFMEEGMIEDWRQ